MTDSLEVTSIDELSSHIFIVYFSDGTLIQMTAKELALCFPNRTKVNEISDLL